MLVCSSTEWVPIFQLTRVPPGVTIMGTNAAHGVLSFVSLESFYDLVRSPWSGPSAATITPAGQALLSRVTETCYTILSPPVEHRDLLAHEDNFQLVLMVLLPLTLSLFAVHLSFRNFFLICWLSFKLALSVLCAMWLRSWVHAQMQGSF